MDVTTLIKKRIQTSYTWGAKPTSNCGLTSNLKIDSTILVLRGCYPRVSVLNTCTNSPYSQIQN